MVCGICGEFFYIRRSLLDLFKTKKEYICNRCYKKYPIHIGYEAIQLDLYNCIIISMFERKERIEYNAFFKEYGKIFLANEKREGFHQIFLNHLDLNNEDTIEALDSISKLHKSNIIVLCLSIKK